MSTQNPYSGEDRRAEKAIPMHVLSHVAEVVEQFRKDENARHERLDAEISDRFRFIHERFDNMEEKIHHLNDSISAFMGKSEVLFDAFPNQDPDGHRRAHEMQIEEARERKEFYATMKKELAKYGLLGFAGWLFFQALNYLRHGS